MAIQSKCCSRPVSQNLYVECICWFLHSVYIGEAISVHTVFSFLQQHLLGDYPTMQRNMVWNSSIVLHRICHMAKFYVCTPWGHCWCICCYYCTCTLHVPYSLYLTINTLKTYLNIIIKKKNVFSRTCLGWPLLLACWSGWHWSSSCPL